MIDPRIAAACALTAGAIVGAAGCGSSTSTTTRTVTQTQTVTVTTTGTTTTGTTTTAPSAKNLPVLRCAAGTAADCRRACKFAAADRLRRPGSGRTYHAYDPASDTYWAGAQLIATANSAAGHAAVINEGAYLLDAPSPSAARGASTGSG